MIVPLLVLAATAAGSAVPSVPAQVTGLRCEYLTNPLGIDAPAPRLSWIVDSHRRGDRQTAYQVLVASSADRLANGHGDLWDSGNVISGQTNQIAYGGHPLKSRLACHWKVRIWDMNGKPSEWSAPALWTMGLLERSDWHARWLAAPPILLDPSAHHSLVIHKATYAADDGSGTADVTDIVKGRVHDNLLDMVVNNQTRGGDPVPGHVKHLHLEYTLDGKDLEVDIAEDRSVTLAEVATSLPYIRKSFVLDKPIESATLYATALGLYRMSVNRIRVGNHVLAPDWTDYGKRIRYQAYDVTKQVKVGDNAMGALVANGWYSGRIGNGGYQHYGKVPALLAQLEVVYTDGTSTRIVTDESWKTHAGPILSADFMMGESYDATREIAGWDRAGLDESGWANATTREEPARPLEAQVMEPVRVTHKLSAKTCTETSPGHWTFDIGQNMVGVIQLKISEPAGTKITLHHAEMLNPDGTVYTTNLRGAPSIDTYVAKGDKDETWRPRFTFHGFRYVDVSGLTGKPALDTVTGIVFGSDTPPAGEFSCSDERLNQLQSNIQWGQRGNYLSVPTDCPQRDERMGWMGDAQVFVRTAAYNADIAAFYTKWLVDVDDAQTEDGAYSDISPSYGGGGTPAWADAGVICPWTIYLAYGDKQLLRRHLPNMTRWVEWCRVHSTGLIRDKDRNGDFGDWLSIGADTPKDLIGTAYFAYSTHLLAKSYRAVGNAAQAGKYERLFEEIKAAFNKRYVAADGRIEGNTQCCYAMALKFELLPEKLRPLAAEYLAEDIEAKGWHLSTGFVGVSYLLPVLTDAGKVGDAYKLLRQDTFPSWLFSVKHGATTIWERWDGWTPEHGFQDPGMNSFNHYALGSCGEWLFDTVAGIAPDAERPGYEHVFIHPQTNGPLTWAKGTYDSIRGRIACRWKRDHGKMTLDITIPAGSTATVFVPTATPQSVMESSRPAAQADCVRFLKYEGGDAVYEVQSGQYHFSSSVQ